MRKLLWLLSMTGNVLANLGYILGAPAQQLARYGNALKQWAEEERDDL